MLAFLCCYPSSEKQLFVSDGTEPEPEQPEEDENRVDTFEVLEQETESEREVGSFEGYHDAKGASADEEGTLLAF